MEDPTRSIIQYVEENSGYKCGYCKSASSNYSNGMWAHQMSVGNYQDLIDRGWRRSGKYCYKPILKKTCCPQYPIKCDALLFKLSKSQKKVLKRMNKFLNHGSTKADVTTNKVSETDMNVDFRGSSEFVHPKDSVMEGIINVQEQLDNDSLVHNKEHHPTEERSSLNMECSSSNNTSNLQEANEPSSLVNKSNKMPKPGVGADTSRSACRKAKDIRKERRQAKLAQKHSSKDDISDTSTKPKNAPKSLEEYINQPLSDNPAHKLELRLIKADISEADFFASFDTSFDIFRKYQMKVHNDQPGECDRHSYLEFLVQSPLATWVSSVGPPKGFGSFHQQYWLDDELIAVGVLDVLPHCVSSVYLFYNPDYSFLSLGTYSSLRELALTRQLQKYKEDLKWYYMGFYIHSCPKMKYKGQYNPSFLLCPETYNWVDISSCTPKLDKQKYCRFSPDQILQPTIDASKVMCLYKSKVLPFSLLKCNDTDSDDEETIKEYCELVGKAAYSMFYILK